MAACESRLAPLLSTHDLRLACTRCSVQEAEITYTLKSEQHQCERHLLLCRAKNAVIWRPVFKRPMFPNPNRYEVCWFYREGKGCSQHKNRCSFARSEEEAAVWNFEKRHQVDHALLCQLITPAPSDREPYNTSRTFADLLKTLDLKVGCELCCTKEKEVTYSAQPVHHTCGRTLLLAKSKSSEQWRPVSERPTSGQFGPKVNYQQCRYFSEGSGCTLHGQKCTYARSFEEAAVWNHIRDRDIGRDALMREVIDSEPVLLTPEHAAESILKQFPGEFLQLCKVCFHDKKLSGKRWNATCSADAAHAWEPVLVHHMSERGGKHIYSQVRPLSPNCQFKFCSHVRQGKPCWHPAGHCGSAQSEVEMAVWRTEHGGLSVRSRLLQLSQQNQSQHNNGAMYCKVCLLVLSSPESFYKHCSSLEHAQLLSEDTTTRWRGRRPPHGQRADFWLCDRPLTCEYGEKCPKAHSEEELQEWMMRAVEEKEIRHNIDAQGLMCYNEKLLEEYRNSSNEVYILSENADDVRISCDEDLSVELEEVGVTLQWHFQVETERQLLHVALLKQEPGASFSLGNMSPVPCIYSSGKLFLIEDTTYDITVSFSSMTPGLYEQWLVLDFDMRPVLLRKLRVRVGPPPLDEPEEPAWDQRAAFQTTERWHRGNRVIIPCSSRTEEKEELLKEYKPPQINFLYKSSHNKQTPLDHGNYRERMHHFLYEEERAEDRVVLRLNVCGEITTLDTLMSTKFGIMVAPPGQLFCAVSIPCSLTPDTPEGQALRRSIQSGLIASLSSNSKVYEASILPDKTSEKQIHLQLSKKCCSDLSLRRNQKYQMEVQFQLNRFSFCTMHKAVDLLPDTRRVLPDLRRCEVPQNNVLHEKLNPKQQSALDFIMGKALDPKKVAPLLIYGPFGTGKTFTLATAARELSERPQSKVLICTYTNSSADLYVRDHFHPFVNDRSNGLRPIRIKANKQGKALFATDEITLKYCLLSDDGQHFLPPTKAALDGHKIVITTTSMARHFHELKLPEGYFSHILIDEASQMLECEALMALSLAGPETRVVLAGDHMQMGPKLFSVDDHHRSNYTLLNRLFHFYQGQKNEAAHGSRIIFSENYRSTAEIVEFVSTYFYVGKNDVIKAAGNIPPPVDGHALNFHHVRGECLLDTASMSWYNREEVSRVVQAVKGILKRWPPTWGTKDQSSICVLSEGHQVRLIRASLSKRGFHEVHAENLANVQGKQFRVVVITAVQTRHSLQRSHLAGLELFNDARVLNTAMTRAQSQVVVVGDAAALCCFGKCSAVWKSYVDHCIINTAVEPKHLTKEFFEKDILETVRFQKRVHEDDSEVLTDSILQEMKDEYEQLESEYIRTEERLGGPSADHQGLNSLNDDEDQQPKEYTYGKVIRESSGRGYVIPFHNPANHVYITGRDNLGKVFSGDEVELEGTRVVGITKEAEKARVLVCLLEDENYSKLRKNTEDRFVKRLMSPLKKSEPKIRILINKKTQNFMPIWEKFHGEWKVVDSIRMNENLRLNNAFLVQVIGWKEPCPFPLGKVISVIPIGRSLAEGLRILNEEFKVEPNIRTLDNLFSQEDSGAPREDLCDVKTFTVDPEEAEDLDDAVSVREMEDHYELGIHIADVASYVRPGGELDEFTKQRGTSYYCRGKNPIHMFPENWSTEHLSLLEGEERRVVSLMFQVDKETHKIKGEPRFQLSVIRSDGKLSYEKAEEEITERLGRRPSFATVGDCVSVAYCFAKAQRKERLVDWAYSQPDEQRVPGKRKAHLMIEELSVQYNKHAAETLTGSDRTKNFTPLRCQKEPNPERIKELLERCGGLLPLSFAVRDRVKNDGRVRNCINFPILTKVWNDIQDAAADDDVDKLVDLIAADDIHPLLKPVVDEFRGCLSKAHVIPFRTSSTKAEVRHYSLSIPVYTQASSPIRRYMDIVLQRLLHSFICSSVVQYTEEEITSLCREFEQTFKSAKEYDQKAEQIFYAVSMKKQSAAKLAFVVSVESAKDSFEMSFPFNKNIFSKSFPMMYKDLQLWDQPEYDEENHSIRLAWKKCIYAVGTLKMEEELRMLHSGPCVELPLTLWKDTIEALDQDNWRLAKGLILNGRAKGLQKREKLPQELPPAVLNDMTAVVDNGSLDHAKPCTDGKRRKNKKGKTLPQSSEMSPPVNETCNSEDEEEEPGENEVDIKLDLKAGDTLLVQMTSEIKRGYHVPAVQLIRIKPKFEICVEHVHSPITCFSRSADDPAKIYYRDIQEYQKIWKPLCEMESAANAVNEENSIIIEDLVVNFKQERKGTLTGSFFLPEEWIDDWGIESNLSKCFLCIRKRGLELEMETAPEHSALVDPREYTWVAHGITRRVDKRKKPQQGSKVEFDINHLPMDHKPACVFQKDTSFTVEIIPKSLPDIRKEYAVLNITEACDLVQTIARGYFPKEKNVEMPFRRMELGNELPDLNTSQRQAVNTALNNSFTLIQGPPGTGKTIVGVYLVCKFFELNSQTPRVDVDPKDKNKREVILYCGPSNKSVDVVAEYLLRFGDKLKPLRVYGQQVEMVDFPYPGSTLQVSRSAPRQGGAKEELKSITLHYRIRQEQNPFSRRIKEFDDRIRRARETKKKSDRLTDEEVKEYKKLLKDARVYELERHDIILCTCTQSSALILKDTVRARQILIDECAMATEPQALVPLVCNKPEKIVLIGDHKQLQPVVRNEHVKKLGMAKSLFERFYTMPEKKAVMLNIQYRMHREICEFPSKEYYEGKLQTGVDPPCSALCVGDKSMRIIFGDCKGKVISLVVNTAKGNENSKANKEERVRAVAIAEKLVKDAKINQEDIVILSPYNAQVTEIREHLRKRKLEKITATTITKSQGSEWRYVIISTVSSLPTAEILTEPDGAWLAKHLGFLGFPNQINVAITRAKDGLCIIGDQELLSCSRAWRKLLSHYLSVGAVTNAEKISVKR